MLAAVEQHHIPKRVDPLVIGAIQGEVVHRDWGLGFRVFDQIDKFPGLQRYLSLDMYCSEMRCSQGGMVAENNKLCTLFALLSISLSYIYSMSSWKPMFSITSASSSTIVCSSLKLRTFRSNWFNYLTNRAICPGSRWQCAPRGWPLGFILEHWCPRRWSWTWTRGFGRCSRTPCWPARWAPAWAGSRGWAASFVFSGNIRSRACARSMGGHRRAFCRFRCGQTRSVRGCYKSDYKFFSKLERLT